jgi:hypothetical protein
MLLIFCLYHRLERIFLFICMVYINECIDVNTALKKSFKSMSCSCRIKQFPRNFLRCQTPRCTLNHRFERITKVHFLLFVYLVRYLLIRQPCNNKEHCLELHPPLSHFDPLVIKFKITILAPMPFYISGSTCRILQFNNVYFNAPFGTNLYLCVLQISRV